MYKTLMCYFLLMILSVSAFALNSFGKNQPLEIKLGREALGKVPTIEVVVNGKSRLFYFDSGGGISAISPELAKEIGCEPFGEMTGYNAGGMKFDIKRCEDVSMSLGDFSVKRDVAVFDPMKFFPKATMKIEGSIALDVFENRMLTMNFVGNRFLLENEKSFKRRIKDMKPLLSRLSREAGGATLDFFVAVQTPQGRIWLLHDTGNTNRLLFRKSAQKQLGISLYDEKGKKIQKPVKIDLIGYGSVEADALPRDMIYDGMLNYEIIEKMLWTVDLKIGKVWAKANK
jgi:hypothetical protein